MRISTFNERRSVSDIIKRSSPTRATSTTTARRTPPPPRPARCCCLSQRRGRARGASGRRVARVDAIFNYIRQFLFSIRSLCVRRRVFLFLSSIQSPTAASARVSKDTLDAEQDLRNVNDPSAGSPTETLLRLLLPLNDQVWSSSRQHRQCRDIAAHQSEDLTKSFNR